MPLPPPFSLSLLSFPLFLTLLISTTSLAQPLTIIPNSNSISSRLPPPPCLKTCIDRYTPRVLCTPAGDADIASCYETLCGYPPSSDSSFAEVYYASICHDGGYRSCERGEGSYVRVGK
ncbi:hypothetical protein G7Y79_00002g005400 [Physcia stellaris]|nr:hypothetical protein G7Y79_00002g005400 [Physcia stellaris]